MSSSSSSKEEIVPAGTYYSNDFEVINNELRQHVKLANKEIDNVKAKVNELVTIVHNDNKEWSLKKICSYIAGRNDDLEEYGFSARTIHNYLNEENRQLVDKQKQRLHHQPSQSLEELRQEKGTIEHNNVLEQSGESLHQKDLEESSSSNKRTLPTAYDIKDAETAEEDEEEEPEEIYDKQFVDRLIKENAQLVNSFTFEYDLEVKDQILPLKVTCYPDKKTGFVRLDKGRLKK
jgi:hypothetical protein